MSVRTDLAVESLTAAVAIEPKQRGTYFQITEVTISNAEQAAAVGKPEGHYLTLKRQLCTVIIRSFRSWRKNWAGSCGHFCRKAVWCWWLG